MSRLAELERLADAWVAAHDGDAAAVGALNRHYGRDFAVADLRAEIWRRVYAYRQRSSRVDVNALTRDEARLLLAQDAGHGSWDALVAADGAPPPGDPFDLDDELGIAPRRRLTDAEWDRLLAVARERGVTALDARGLMTDAVLRRVAALDRLTTLNLAGCRELGDDGLLALARMPWLERLELGGRVGDDGLAVLRELPALRTLRLPWASRVTDAGLQAVRACRRMEEVSLMGTATGDGAIAALEGMPALRRLETGRLVTPDGARALAAIPRLAAPDGDASFALLLDGPVGDEGLAVAAALPGLAELDLFWHVERVSPAGFAALARAPRIASLGADGALANDDTLPLVAAMPALRRLRIQEAAATDDGFAALGRSTTLETIWGRVCEGFGDRGFRAFAAMPALRDLGIGLAGVSDAALDALPSFPALERLTPIGLTDARFAPVGRCARLVHLSCMYCRETGDAATEAVAGLRLRTYYAGLTRITDRSLAILGGMASLERIELYECLGVTDAGLAHLAALPALRELAVSAMPGVTLEGTRVMPARVRVRHST